MPGCSLFLGMRKDWNGLALVNGFQMWNFVLDSKEMEGFVIVSLAIAGSVVGSVYGFDVTVLKLMVLLGRISFVFSAWNCYGFEGLTFRACLCK